MPRAFRSSLLSYFGKVSLLSVARESCSVVEHTRPILSIVSGIPSSKRSELVLREVSDSTMA